MKVRSRLTMLTALLIGGSLHAAGIPRFVQPNAIWNVDVTSAPTRLNSGPMMTHLEAIAATHPQSGKWGDNRGNVDFQIDFSFYVLHATNATPVKPIVAFPSLVDYYSPDCESPSSSFRFPVVPGGGIEGTDPPAYSCDTNNNDCHLLTVNDSSNVLYESYYTDSVDAAGIHSICGLSWDLKKVYPRYGRGEHCTSADGAGFPIAPLLFNADEVWSAAQVQGDLGHAIRWIIGNERMQQNTHVHPSSHGTSATSDTNANAVPYGSRLRLKATFAGGKTVTTFSSNEATRAVLRTLQKYGMFLSDGGGIPLTAEADNFNTHKWADADVNIDSHSFFGIRPTDFDVIEAGDPLANDGAPNNGDCTLTPPDFIFIDGYDY
jgi:serine/threonine-protein kinase